ncbi:MAG: hypothetical protein U0836_26150 [Pirellulales bacterium]
MKRLLGLTAVAVVGATLAGCTSCWPRKEQCGPPPAANCPPGGMPTQTLYSPPGGYDTAPMILPGPTTYRPG